MIVCLHGFGQAPAIWDGIAPPEAMALPLPGHAGAPPAETFDAAVERLAAQIPAGAAVAGYSLGARLALAIALRDPARLRAALLVGGSPGIEGEADRAARVRWDDEMASRLEREGIDAFVARWEALPIFSTQTDAMRAAQRPARLAQDPLALAAAMRSLGQGRMPSLWTALAAGPVPLRLLVGARDAKYAALAERMVSIAPRATRRIVPDVGHNLLVEAPAVVREELSAL